MGKNRKTKDGESQVHCSVVENIKSVQSTVETFGASKDSLVQQKISNDLLSVHDSNSLPTSLEHVAGSAKCIDSTKETVNDKLNTKLTEDSPLICNSIDFCEESTRLIVDNNSFALDLKKNPSNSDEKVHEGNPKSYKGNVPSGNIGLSSYSESSGISKKSGKKNKKKLVDEEVERLLKELQLDDVETLTYSNKVTPSASSAHFHDSCQINCDIKRNEIIESESVIESCSEVSMPTNNNVLINGSEKSSNITQKRKEKKLKSKQKKKETDKVKCCTSDNTESLEYDENQNGGSVICPVREANNIVNKNGAIDKKDKKRPSKKIIAVIQEAVKKAKEKEEKSKKEEEAKRKMAEEAEKLRLEKLKAEQEKKEKKRLKEKQRKEKRKAEGKLLSKSQKQSRARLEATLAIFKEQGVKVPEIIGKCSDSQKTTVQRERLDSTLSTQSGDSAIHLCERHKTQSLSSQESSGKDSLSELTSGCESTDDSLTPESDNFSSLEGPLDNVAKSSIKTSSVSTSENALTSNELVLKSQSGLKCQKLRSPVICVLGHVDTGKTKILDYIRKTHVQDSEAGGITQQIGATMIPRDALKEKCKMVKNFSSFEMNIPGLLVIDTPGHESFQNLRSRGSSVCDLAILVVDIMHGLEPQTLESINLLKMRKIPFIVALNKIDRLYGWKNSNDDIEITIKNQSQMTSAEFKKRCQELVLQFANQCLNAALFYENPDPRSYVSMVPTSAITGDGMGNMLASVAQLTQTLMYKKLVFSDELEATVLEVKTIPGLGTTIDVILVNGCLREGDTIVLAGQEGPIVTQIRSLLMPHPLKELRVKNAYVEYKSVEGAQGVKVIGKDLDKALAGLPLFVANSHGKTDACKEEVNRLLQDTVNAIKTSERGVYVQASTLGSLEALLNFLSASGIDYFCAKIGPVVKKDVMKASIMLEHDVQYAVILAFDVKIERDAQELADSLGVRIFHANIIYHLHDMYLQFREDLISKRLEETKRLAVYPCKLKILPDYVVSVKDPISLAVRVEEGTLKLGTPLCALHNGIVELGSVVAMEIGNNKVSSADRGEEVLIKIEGKHSECKTYGKHFTHEDALISRITRVSIDICKEHLRNELQPSDWHLIVELKKMLHIV